MTLRSKKTRFSLGDALLCVALAARLHADENDIRLTARRVQKRLPKANRWPFVLIVASSRPREMARIILDDLLDGQ